MTTPTFCYSDFLDDGTYVGPDRAVGARWNKQMGHARDGRRVVYYFDAGYEFIGWSFLMDHTTDIGKPVDTSRVYRVWVPLRDDDPRRALGQIQELKIRLSPPSNYPDPD